MFAEDKEGVGVGGNALRSRHWDQMIPAQSARQTHSIGMVMVWCVNYRIQTEFGRQLALLLFMTRYKIQVQVEARAAIRRVKHVYFRPPPPF
jgi:hypothetical protein